jgi:nickel-dependent lactate racemase
MQQMRPSTIPFGSEQLQLLLPSGTVALEVRDVPREITPAVFSARLHAFLRQNPLDLAEPVLIVADKTRLCGYPEYLPLLIDGLHEHGMDGAKLKIVIAYGTHPRQSDAECARAYGEVYRRHTFIHHDCREDQAFVDLGVTARNTPVRFRNDLAEASSIITMGAITHHYFAGYGGGRKLVFPGCGEKESIYANHSLFLDRPSGTLSPGCQPGVMDGNPLAEDLFDIEEKLPAHLAIHGILDAHGHLCDLLVGRGRASFLQACARHGQACEIDSRRFSTVIASCGGFPKDINFIQSHKAVHNAAMFVEDGGLLLVYCECRDGVGSTTFLPWFAKGSFAAAFTELADRYEGNGGTALAMMTKLQRIRIGLVTSLDDTTCKAIGVTPWSHGEVQAHLAALPADATVAFIGNASLVVKKSR